MNDQIIEDVVILEEDGWIFVRYNGMPSSTFVNLFPGWKHDPDRINYVLAEYLNNGDRLIGSTEAAAKSIVAEGIVISSVVEEEDKRILERVFNGI